MLPRSRRLPRKAAPHPGKEMRATSPHFSLRVVVGAEGSGVVVSKKTEKTAVGRHRLKRRALSVLLPWCSPARSVVVYARSGSATLPYALLKAELAELLTRLLGPGRTR